MSENKQKYSRTGITPLDDLAAVYAAVFSAGSRSYTKPCPQIFSRFTSFYESLNDDSVLVLAFLAHNHGGDGKISVERIERLFHTSDEHHGRYIVYDLFALGYAQLDGEKKYCGLSNEAYAAFRNGTQMKSRNKQITEVRRIEDKDFDVLEDFNGNSPYLLLHGNDVKEVLLNSKLEEIAAVPEWLDEFEQLLKEDSAEHYRNVAEDLGITGKDFFVRQAFWLMAASFIQHFMAPLAFINGNLVVEGGEYSCRIIKTGLGELAADGFAISLPIEKDENTKETDRFVLSPRVAGALFKGQVNRVDYGQMARYADVITADQIDEKGLFFPDATNEAIDRLRTMLSDEGFARACQILKNKKKNQAIHALFWGPPGTGKTEVVKQLARETGRTILLVDTSKLYGSLWGESEKAFRGLFLAYEYIVNLAPKTPILLMNEADNLLARRVTRMERAVDRAENAVSNIVLQGIEDMSGILLATTNLVGNIDPAFDRRFLFKVELPNPDEEARFHIWKSLIPELTDKEARNLAARFLLSGAQINNVAAKRDIAELYFQGDRGLDFIVNICEEELSTSRERSGKRAHLQSSVEVYPKILHSLNMKKGRSDTPLS